VSEEIVFESKTLEGAFVLNVQVHLFEADSQTRLDFRRLPPPSRGPREETTLDLFRQSVGLELPNSQIVEFLPFVELRDLDSATDLQVDWPDKQGAQLSSDLILSTEAISCFDGLPWDELEDGMTGVLGAKIARLVERYRSAAVVALDQIISSGKVPPEAASHALRWLGRMKDAKSHDARLQLLVKSLQSSSPVIRDGAALGLAILDDTRAISALRRTIEQERFPGLRCDMQQVLTYLERQR
jgi:hypothetical protein